MVKETRAVAAIVDGIERDMSFVVNNNCKISEPILADSEQGLYDTEHILAHLLAQAVVEMYPDAKPTIGPPIEHGFYYDFLCEPISDSELKKIEKKMNQLVRENIVINREDYGNEELREMFSENKLKLKLWMIKLEMRWGRVLIDREILSIYVEDLTLPSTSHLRWFKLTSTSQAYWRADKNREGSNQEL